ncbi:hypothetical protein FJZ18_00780 [Candidatus Pacearchaeota archaeon]|nr:hypothetical protein [Candidatus Pacearchaeota archaeon]
MVIKSRENIIGARAFLAGVIIAAAIGLLFGSGLFGNSIDPLLTYILAILGITVGIFVAEKDVQTFLLASVSLVLVCYVGVEGNNLIANIRGLPLNNIFTSILNSLLTLFIPATIIVAIKTVFSISKS